MVDLKKIVDSKVMPNSELSEPEKVEMRKEHDTKLSPELELAERLTEQMKLEGSSNDLDHSSFVSAEEGNMLGDGVPGYEGAEVSGGDDETEQQVNETIKPKMTPY